MKRSRWLLAVMVVLIGAGAAWAEYGEWALQQSDWNYNNVLLGVDAPTEDTIYMAGVWTDNIATFKFIYKSDDGGASRECIREWTMSPNPEEICDMLHITDVRTSLWMIDENKGFFGGSGVSQECIDMFGPDIFAQMTCLIVCAMTIGPSIWVTEDGGETFTDVNLPSELGESVQNIYFANDQVGYAVGLAGYIIKTTNGGNTWTRLPDLTQYYTVGEASINDIFCLDEDTCYLALGEWDPDEPEKNLAGRDAAEHHIHRMMLSSDPTYRNDYWMTREPTKNDKYVTGGVLKTSDGGQTWDVLHQSAKEGYDVVRFINENEGWIIGNMYVAPTDGEKAKNVLSMLHTTDGGVTWENYVGHLPPDFTGLQGGWSPTSIEFFNEDFGFILGYGARILSYGPAFLYTFDGGQTWTQDTAAATLNGGQFDLHFVNSKVAYSVGLYLNLMRYSGVNTPPVADAGEDEEVLDGTIVQLDGSGSYDPDGDELAYAWSQISGPNVILFGENSVTPTFIATDAGEVVIQLVVNDGEEDSQPDEVTIIVLPVGDDDDDDNDTDDDAVDDDTIDDDVADDDDSVLDDDQGDDDDDDDDGCGC